MKFKTKELHKHVLRIRLPYVEIFAIIIKLKYVIVYKCLFFKEKCVIVNNYKWNLN